MKWFFLPPGASSMDTISAVCTTPLGGVFGPCMKGGYVWLRLEVAKVLPETAEDEVAVDGLLDQR